MYYRKKSTMHPGETPSPPLGDGSINYITTDGAALEGLYQDVFRQQRRHIRHALVELHPGYTPAWDIYIFAGVNTREKNGDAETKILHLTQQRADRLALIDLTKGPAAALLHAEKYAPRMEKSAQKRTSRRTFH